MYFLILLIYNSFFFFFSEHFSVPTTGLPPILAAIEHTQILSSLSPLSPLFLLLLTTCMLFPPSFTCGAPPLCTSLGNFQEGEMGPPRV